jgi:hypothetical protein
VLERWRDTLLGLSDVASPSSAVTRIEECLPTQNTCLVCRACAAVEAASLAAIGRRLDGRPAAVSVLSALCLSHLAQLLACTEDPSLRRALLTRQAGLFERTADDMRRYALKREGLRRELASRAEDEAGTRAMSLLAGQPNLSFVRHHN